MANVYFTNYSLAAANDAFSAIWKLTRAMKKAGWIYKASGNGSGSGTPERTGVASADLWGGNADPALDSYPTFTSVAAWWCAQGPSVMKIPFTTASTGTFLRGEKITQATSAAEGELVGYDYDGSSTGHLVVLPRVGTFDNSHLITGASSGATLTPSGTVHEYVSEVVIQKSSANLTQGAMLVQRVSNQTENASRLSVLAASAGCTQSVCPGGGGTGNATPSTGTWAVHGTFTGSTGFTTWFGASTSLGKAQIVAANCTPDTGVSADGSFWIGLGVTSTSTKFNVFGYFRMDNSEDGDLDPYVTFKPSALAYNDVNIRVDTNSTDVNEDGAAALGAQNSQSPWKAWRRRGYPSDEQFVVCYGAVPAPTASSTNLMVFDTATAETVACSYSTKRVREPITITSTTSTKKIRKGTVRWMHVVQGGNTFDTFDTKLRMVMMKSGSTWGSIIVGPYDGTTTPLQS